jgi:hypothetical protein
VSRFISREYQVLMVCYKWRKIDDFEKSTDKRECLQCMFACVCVCVREKCLFKAAASLKDDLIWAADCCIEREYEASVKYFCHGKTEEFSEF